MTINLYIYIYIFYNLIKKLFDIIFIKTVNCFKRFINYKKPIEQMLTDIQNGKLRTNDETLSSLPVLNEGPQAYYSTYS